MWFHDTALARVKRRKERRNESKETIAFLANAQNMK